MKFKAKLSQTIWKIWETAAKMSTVWIALASRDGVKILVIKKSDCWSPGCIQLFLGKPCWHNFAYILSTLGLLINLCVALHLLDYLELVNRNGWITIRSVSGVLFLYVLRVILNEMFHWKHSLSTINLLMVLYIYTFNIHTHRRKFREVWAFWFINTKRK